MSYFTALAVPPSITKVLAPIRPTFAEATFTHADDYHLTLKYLGNPTPEILDRFVEVISKASSGCLTVQLTRLHILERPDMHFLVALADLSPTLHNLHLTHEKIALSLGVEPYLFPSYIPHVTLASYPPQTAPALQQLPSGLDFTATAITLFQSSKAHGTGVGRYSPIQTWPLEKI